MLGAAKAVVLGACAPQVAVPGDHVVTITSSFAALQSTINAATAPATVVVTRGSYTLTSTIIPKTGVWIKGDSVTIDPNGLMVFDLREGQSNVWISGFTINGAPTDGLSGLVNINNGCDDIHIVNNTFLNFGAAIWIWYGNNIYVQGNLFQTGTQAISSRMNGGGPIDMQVISDNKFIDNTRFAVETGHFATGQTNFHCDRNLVHGTGDLGLSIIGYYGSGTVWGNEISGRTTGGGIELGNGGGGNTHITASNNYCHDNYGPGFLVAPGPGSVYENNILDSNGGGGFAKDGGWNGSEWIGVNRIDGLSVTGAFGAAYGAKPQTYRPSSSPS
jgi:Right handed beta helix region